MSADISSLRLPDSAFWDADGDRTFDPVVRALKTTHFGVIADAPREVVLSGHDTLPLFAYYLGSFKQVASRPFPGQALLVSIDPDLNEMRYARAIADDGERVREPNKTKEADLPEGFSADFYTINVRERLNLPWIPQRVISQLVLLDLPSNRVETKLLAGTSAFVDPEKEKFLAGERAKLNPPAPFPAFTKAAYPTIEEGMDSPAIPGEFGVSLAASRVTAHDGKKPLLLYGSWRLPIAPEETVKPANTAYNKVNGLTAYAAIVGVHLLITATESAPISYRLNLPATSVSGPPGARVASGFFTLDLAMLPNFPLSEQTLFIYAYAKEWSTGPTTIGLVDRRPHEE